MLSRTANSTLNDAESAKKMNDEFVSIEHLVFTFFNKAGQIFKVTEKLKAAIDELRKGERVTSASAEENV
jgi:ATP-dependent Clp protease ATP-binding subunit ClpB